MASGGVDEQGISTGIDDSLGASHELRARAHGGAAAQTPEFVLGGFLESFALADIGIRNQAGQAAVLVDKRELFDAVGEKNLAGFLLSGLGGAGDETAHGGHHIGHGELVEVMAIHHAHIAAGDDADEHIALGHHGQAGETVLEHDALHAAQAHIAGHGERLGDNGVLETLHLGHHGGLVIDAVVAVNHTQTAFAGHGNGHVHLGHRVHRCGKNRKAQRETSAELGRRVGLAGKNCAQAGKQKHIVKCKSKLNFCHSGDYYATPHFASLI